MFLGRESVIEDLEMHKLQAGYVVPGTYTPLGGSPVDWENIADWPHQEVSGIGNESAANQGKVVTLWKVNEAEPIPRADCLIIVGGKTWNIISVQARISADEGEGFAIYECQCVRKG